MPFKFYLVTKAARPLLSDFIDIPISLTTVTVKVTVSVLEYLIRPATVQFYVLFEPFM